MHLRKLLIGLFLLMSPIVWAQHATIRGFVYEKKSGEPMSYVMVVLQGADMGV